MLFHQSAPRVMLRNIISLKRMVPTHPSCWGGNGPKRKVFWMTTNKHTFCFATRLNGERVSIDAYEEAADPGYRFQVVGEAMEVQKLFAKLLGKMRRALTWQHLAEEDGRLKGADDLEVRGRVE